MKLPRSSYELWVMCDELKRGTLPRNTRNTRTGRGALFNKENQTYNANMTWFFSNESTLRLWLAAY